MNNVLGMFDKKWSVKWILPMWHKHLNMNPNTWSRTRHRSPELTQDLSTGCELWCVDHSWWVPVSPQPGHRHQKNRAVWLQLVHWWPHRTRAGTLPARRHQGGASFVQDDMSMINVTSYMIICWRFAKNFNFPCIIHRFVISSPNGSKPPKSSSLASLRTPGLLDSPTRTGKGWTQLRG